MRNWIKSSTALSIFAIVLTLGSLLIDFNNDDNGSSASAFKEIPVMKLNIYMMGRQDVDPSISIKIFENIDYLNKAFKGQISFEVDELFMDPNQAYLPDLYKSYRRSGKELVGEVVAPIEKKGGINVYLFDTYCEPGRNDALMGFTPLLSSRQSAYANNSPRFDRILMAYDGLSDNKTLVHEMGHFFGLKHPWELSTLTKQRLGIRTSLDESSNHMSYGNDVQKFTTQQLEDMRHYAMRYRTYLMDRVLRVHTRA